MGAVEHATGGGMRRCKDADHVVGAAAGGAQIRVARLARTRAARFRHESLIARLLADRYRRLSR